MSSRNSNAIVYRGAIGVALFCMLALRCLAEAESVSASVDASGTIHVRELMFPPSALWSQEFRQYKLARLIEHRRPIPARDAPKSEWDKYAEHRDTTVFAPLLAKALEIYPVKIEDATIGGVHVGIVFPQDGVATENRRRVLINLRGGAFVQNQGLNFGLLDSIPVAAIGRIKVITLDYRQAPAYSYPAATEDVEAVYRDLLKHHKSEEIGIYGCSAGGALTAQAVAWFQAKKLPSPGAVGIHCTTPSPSWGPRGGDSDIWRGLIPKNPNVDDDRRSEGPETWYMEGALRDDPIAYPETSDAVLARFPPTLFVTGTRAFEMSATVVAHTRFHRLGVDASLYVMEGAGHADHVFAVGTPESSNAYCYIAHWFEQKLAR